MKLATILLAAAATAVYAQSDAGTVAPGTDAPATEAPVTDAPVTEAPSTPTEGPSSPTEAPSPTSKPSPTASGPQNTEAGDSPLDALKQKSSGYEYQMPVVRVVQARVQSDKPELIKGRFVSIYGKGDLENGYMSALDTVNTASVEGALMYVQAEGINQNSRSKEDRCKRKNNMNWVVLYEILIAQTNETIAQFQDTWNVREYGPMMPMDSGQCTPLSGTEFPPECMMFNGIDGYPNVGPFIGAGLKNNDVRAPYPDNYWFSFPHTCPLKKWGDKPEVDDACRTGSRKGLCDMGKAPDGIECTFAYDILGWVPIDDVVGITSLTDDNGNAYGNFTSWCEASEKHIEFAGDDKTGEMTEGLPFWENPKDIEANGKRAGKVVDIYQAMLNGSFVSTQVSNDDLKYFKFLPNPADLAELNPPCYKTVPDCNSGSGCERKGFSQLCTPCTSGGCKTDASYTFPKLAKAPTTRKDSELSSGSRLSDVTGANGNQNGTNTGSPAAPLARAGLASVAAVAIATIAFAL